MLVINYFRINKNNIKITPLLKLLLLCRLDCLYMNSTSGIYYYYCIGRLNCMIVGYVIGNKTKYYNSIGTYSL